MAINPKHTTEAARAKALYLDGQSIEGAIADWRFAIRAARRTAAAALRASDFLRDIPAALMSSGEHLLALRQVLAPPISQDQFKLICNDYSKNIENKCKPFSKKAAENIAKTIIERLDKGVAGWHSRGQRPGRRELETFLRVSATLIGLQKLSTARRKRLASEQEYAVILMLENEGWSKLPSRLIDSRAAVPPRHFMHKTRFATATTTPQEVDIACGLKDSYVLAMECKVTNDETNSVKRVNDILKKAAAWRTHWGSFVFTAALLQGVIAPKDIQRLSDAGVVVFWSHEIGEFRDWLAMQLR
jgi:XamI restriction endonuclease